MKARLFLITTFLIIPQNASAQETPEANEWTTEQRCVTTFSEPPESWTYDGVIFTLKLGDGVHAIRADFPTSYYVAFDDADEFGAAGSLSPDGRWYAVPAGSRDRNDNIVADYNFYLREIRIYDTSPSHTLLRRIPLYADRFFASATIYGVSPIYWLDATRIVAKGTLTVPSLIEQEYIIEPFDETVVPLELQNTASFISASPDNEHWIYSQRVPNGREIHLAMRNALETAVTLPIAPVWSVLSPKPQWAADSSLFAALLEDWSGVGIFDQDGNLLEKLEADANTQFSLSLDGETFAYVSPELTIQIANLKTHEIIDTCIVTELALENGVAFSPNGDQLVFAIPQRDWTYILDFETWEAYRINLKAGQIIGWYPIS